MLGQVVDDFDTWQVSRQRFALATTFDWGNDFVVRIVNHGQQRLAFRLVEHCQLRRIGIDRLLGFAVVQPITPQLDLFFQVDDVGGIRLRWLPARASVLRKCSMNPTFKALT
ncbi:hypothetical protein BGP83_25010 [Pseudomonas putida]|nr:hypothetical protein BGP83_25010 [Pseudomonas putida]